MSGQGLCDAPSAIYTVITRRKCALRHTSTRCAQYLQDGGLLCDTPPCDLHSIYNAEVCFGTHLRAICTIITNVFKRSTYFGGALCDTPPRDLHSFYKCLWASDMFSFNFGGAFFAHLRAICTVFTTTYAFRRCGETWDFIILNKGRMTPPWREKAKRSQGQRRIQNFNPISVPSQFLSQITQPKLYYEPAPV
jgi:hypothetical protein